MKSSLGAALMGLAAFGGGTLASAVIGSSDVQAQGVIDSDVNNTAGSAMVLGGTFTIDTTGDQFTPGSRIINRGIIVSEGGMIWSNGVIETQVDNFVNNFEGVTTGVGLDGLTVFESGAFSTGQNDASGVDGPVRYEGPGFFTYPTIDATNGACGRSNGYQMGQVSVVAPLAGNNDVEYFWDNPSAVGTARGTGIDVVTACEYWNANGVSALTSAQFEYSASSDVSTLTSGEIGSLRLVGWNGAQWVETGATLAPGSTLTSGGLIYSGAFDDFQFYTFAAGAMADLSVEKSVDNAAPASGTNVTFTVTVNNAGPSDATGVVVTDQLPVGLSYVSDTTSAGAYNDATGQWTVGNLNDGDTETLTITAMAVDLVPGLSDTTNLAFVSAVNEGDPDSIPNNGVDTDGDTSVEDDPGDEDDGDGVIVRPSMIAIGDTVYNDLNGNGVQDVSDVGINAVTVELYNGQCPATGSVFRSTSTNSMGNYTFDDVRSDDYCVVAVPLDASFIGTQNSSGYNINDIMSDDLNADFGMVSPFIDIELDKTVNNATPVIGQNITFSIAVSNPSADITGGGRAAGNATNVLVRDLLASGYSFVSANASQGSYDSGSGVWMVGTLPIDGATQTLDIVATVLASGNYNNLAEVIAADQTDFDSTPDNGVDTNGNSLFADDPGDEDDGDGVVVTPSMPSIGDTVYNDLNGNGSQDVGDFGVSGVTVELYSGLCAAPGAILRTTTTDSNGTYLFQDVVFGDYCVEIIPPTADHSVTQNSGGYSINDISGDDLGADFGVVESIVDLMIDKSVNNATPVMGQNVTFLITLTNESGDLTAAGRIGMNATNVLVRDLLPSGYSFVSATPSQGSYDSVSGVWSAGTVVLDAAAATLSITATVLSSGNYNNLTEVIAADHPDFDSTPNNGVDTNGNSLFADDPGDEDDGDGVVVTPSSITLGDRIYNASTGVATSVGNGIGGVTVQLFDDVNSNGTFEIGTDTLIAGTTTAGDGGYSFTGLPTGDYCVVVSEGTLDDSQFDLDAPVGTDVTPGITDVDDFVCVSNVAATDLTLDLGYNMLPADIRLTKNLLSDPVDVGPNLFEFQFEFRVGNVSSRPLDNVELTDDFDFFFNQQSGSASQITVQSVTTSGAFATGIGTGIGVVAFGAAPTVLLPAGANQTLLPGEVGRVIVSVLLDTDSFQGPYQNQAIALGTDRHSGAVVQDLSSDGTDLEFDDDEITPVPIPSDAVIGLSKQVSVAGVTDASVAPQGGMAIGQAGEFDVVFEFEVENFGNVDLDHLQITDNLLETFPNPSAVVETIVSSADFVVNNGSAPGDPLRYNGISSINLLEPAPDNPVNAIYLANRLVVDEVKTLRLAVRFEANGLFEYLNSADVRADTPEDNTVGDISQDGDDADPDGDENPHNNNEPTPFDIQNAMNPVIGLAKDLGTVRESPTSPGKYEITFNFVVENLGNVDLANVLVYDDLSATFPSGVYEGLVQPIDAAGTLSPNLLYTGLGATETHFANLLTSVSSSLVVGASETLSLTALIDPRNTDPENYGPFDNTAFTEAQAPFGAAPSDRSDDGVVTDFDGDGNPDEVGENDPTPVDLTSVLEGKIGLAKQVTDVELAPTTGNYYVTFEFNVQNNGNVPLDRVQIDDRMDQTFVGAGVSYIGVHTAPVVTSGVNLFVNAGFNGLAGVPGLLSINNDGNELDVGQASIIEVVVEFRAIGPDIGPFDNSAVATGRGPVEAMNEDPEGDARHGARTASDRSQDGPDADRNTVSLLPEDNPGSNGPDNDDPTPVTIPETGLLGLAKRVSVLGVTDAVTAPQGGFAAGAPGQFDVTFEFEVANMGTTPLFDVQVTDDLSLTLPAPADLIAIGAPVAIAATAPLHAANYVTLTMNPGFTSLTNGTQDDTEVLAGTDDLSVGEAGRFAFTVRFDPNEQTRLYRNSALGQARDPDFQIVEDVSEDDADLNPDPTDDGDPTNDNQPTPFDVTNTTTPPPSAAVERIGVAKDMSYTGTGPWTVRIDYTLENFGNLTINDLSMLEDLEPVFGDAFSDWTAVNILDATGPGFAVNPSFIGFGSGSSIDLIAPNSSIEPAEVITFVIEVTVNQLSAVSSLVNVEGDYLNQVTVTGTSSDGNAVSDTSVDGTDPDANDPGETPNDDDPTEESPSPVQLPEITALKLINPDLVAPAASGVDGNFDVTFSLAMTNTGAAQLGSLQMTEDLRGQFGGAFIDVVSVGYNNVTTTVPAGPGRPALNGGFNGTSNINLFSTPSAAVLLPGDRLVVDLVIEVDPNNTTPSAPVLPFENQIEVQGTDVANPGITVTDISANVVDLDDTEEPENPSPVYLPSIGVAKSVVDIAEHTDGIWDVTFEVNFINNGSDTLIGVQLDDDAATQFGGAFVEVTQQPVLTNTSNLSPGSDVTASPVYMLVSTTDLLSPATNSRLAPGDSAALRYTVRVEPASPTAVDPLVNQVRATGIPVDEDGNQFEIPVDLQDPLDPTRVFDLSDDGFDPEGNNGGGGTDDPTPIPVPSISILKTVGTPFTDGTLMEGNYFVPFTLSVFNTGNTALSDIFLEDELDLNVHFGTAFVGIDGAAVYNTSAAALAGSGYSHVPGGNRPLLNATFDGSAAGDPVLLDGTAGLIGTGEALVVDFVAIIDPNAAGAASPLFNQARVTGQSPDAVVVEDLSDDAVDPTDPTGTNPGAPGDNGTPDDPSVVYISSIGISKQVISAMPFDGPIAGVTDGEQLYRVTFQLDVVNNGSTDLVNVTVLDDLTTELGGAFVSVDSQPTIVVAPTDLGSDITLSLQYMEPVADVLSPATSDRLAASDSFSTQFTIIIDPNAPTAEIPLDNQSTATGQPVDRNGDPLGAPVSDLSDAGIDPEGDNGSGGPDDPTPVPLPAISVVKSIANVAQSADETVFTVTYAMIVENVGNVDLTNLTLFDDLADQYGPAFISASAASITIAAGTSAPSALPGANAGFDADADHEILNGAGTLEPGTSIRVTFDAVVDPTLAADTPILNQATTTGDGIDFDGNTVTVTDLSDSGIDPDTDNGGGGTDDPTPLEFGSIAVSKQVTASAEVEGPIAGVTDGEQLYDVTFEIEVINNGALLLTDVTLTDDILAQFGGAFVSVTQQPVMTVEPGASTSNLEASTSYLSPSDDLLAQGVDQRLEVGDRAVIQFTVLVDPNAATATIPLNNQVTASGQPVDENGDPVDGPVTDVSDSGPDPEGTNPGEPGDTGGPDDPTPVPLPAISVVKSIANVAQSADETVFTVTYAMIVENVGNVDLTNLTLFDDLADQYGPAFISASAASITIAAGTSAPSALPGANAGFDADADHEILNGAGTLEPGTSIRVTFDAVVDPTLAADTPILNQATTTGDGIDFDGNTVTVTDLSDSGIDPDTDNGGGGTDDPTPLEFGSIAVSKQVTASAEVEGPIAGVTDGEQLYNVTFEIEVINNGALLLTDVTLTDDILAQFGGAFVSVTQQPVMTVEPGAPTSNLEASTSYLSPSDDLLAQGVDQRLEVGDRAVIQFTVLVDPNAATATIPLNNQVTASGQPVDENGDPVDGPVTDVSDSGPDPEGTNPGEPGDTGGPDDPTPVPLPAISVVKSIANVAQSADETVFTVTYAMIVENVGNVDLTNLTLSDDLATQYGAAFINAATPNITIAAGASAPSALPGANAGFDADADHEILNGAGTLEPGTSIRVTFDAVVDPTLAADTPILNQATTTGDGIDFDGNTVTVTDLSDSGIDPDTDNGGGGTDDPTPLEFGSIAVSKQVTASAEVEGPIAGVTDGEQLYDVTFEIEVINNGALLLTDVTLTDDILAQFGGAFVSVTQQPVMTVEPGASTSNLEASTSYLSPSDDLLAQGVDQRLEVGDRAVIQFTVLVDPNAATATIPLNNQVTASGQPVDENGDPVDGPVTDVSDSGPDPEGTNPGEPGDTGGPDDPTPVPLPAISVVKSIANVAQSADETVFTVTYAMIVENVGNVDLTNLTLFDDLADQYGPAFISASAASITIAAGTSAPSALPGANAGFDADADHEILNGAGTLEPGTSIRVTFDAVVDPTLAADTPILNQATTTGDGIDFDGNTVTVTDLSDSGIDPDTDNGGGGTDDPTPLEFGSIAVSKQVTASAEVEGPIAGVTDGEQLYNVTFEIEVINNGALLLTDVTLTDDILAQFGGAFVSVTQQPVMTVEPGAPTSNLEASTSYLSPSDDLLAQGVDQRLEVGDRAVIQFTVLVDPNAATATIPLNNQVTASGQPVDENGDPVDGPVTDVSDSGPDPEGTNPGEPGDTGGPDDPTPVPLPAISVVKAIPTVTQSADETTLTVTYAMIVENVGNVDLVNLTLLDDLAAQYGPAFLSASAASITIAAHELPAPSALPGANGGFDGSGDPEMLDGGGTLEPGTAIRVTFDAVVDPSLAVDTPLLNQATATGDGIDFDGNLVTVSDLSDSGVNPDTTNPGEPGDTGGTDDPTPLEFGSIGVSKQMTASAEVEGPIAGVTDGEQLYNVTFEVEVVNNGSLDLTDVEVIDNLAAVLPATILADSHGGLGTAFIAITRQPIMVSAPTDLASDITLNAQYMDPSADLLSPATNDILAVADRFTIEFDVLIDPNAAGAPDLARNLVLGSGQPIDENGDPSGDRVNDQSDSGPNPEGTNPGEPGDTGGPDDPTPVPLPAISVVKAIPTVTQSADETTLTVTYAMIVENVGNVDLVNLTLLDDLAAQYGPAFLSASAASITIAAHELPAPSALPGANGGFDGSGDPEMLDGGGTLEPGTAIRVTFDAVVDPSLAVDTPLLNQATATGDGIDFDGNLVTVSDLSDSGVNPDTTNPGEPGDTGGTDDPTPLEFGSIGVSKQMTASAEVEGPIAGVTDGEQLYNVTFEVEVVNNGSLDLTDVEVIDNLAAVLPATILADSHGGLGTAFIAITRQPIMVSAPTDLASDITLNAQYMDPSADLLSPATNDILAVADRFTIEFDVLIDPNAAGAPDLARNLVLGSGQPIDENGDPSGDRVNDQSDSGPNPEGTNPGEPGDTGGPDDPTPVPLPAISVVKAIPTVTQSADETTLTVTYAMIVENVGNVDLVNLTLLDDLAAQYGPAFLSASAASITIAAHELPAPSALPGANGGFDGSGDPEMLDGGGTLEPGTAIRVTFDAVVDPSLAVDTPLLNQATATGDGIDFDGNLVTVSDLSDSGVNPDTTNPGEPGDTGGTDDPTPLEFGSIGVSKQMTASAEVEGPIAGVTDGEQLYNVTFEVEVVNNGSLDLTDVEVVDNLAAVLPATILADSHGGLGTAFIAITRQPIMVSAPTDLASDITLNAQYMDPSADLLSPATNDILAVADRFTIEFDVLIDPNAAGAPDLARNLVLGSGQPIDENGDPSGDRVNDQSDSGPNPEGTNPGEPGDTGGPDDPTPVPLPAISVVKAIPTVTQSADETTLTVTYAMIVENVGNVDLVNLTLLDDLAAQYGPAFLSASAASITIAAHELPAPSALPGANGGFDGSGDPEMLDGGGTLEPGTAIRVTFDAVVDPSLAVDTPLLNQATATGDGIDFDGNLVTVSDLSDSGVNPDTTNPGEPGDTGGADDPTPLQYGSIGVSKQVIGYNQVNEQDGLFDVTFEVEVINNGSLLLTDITLVDDLAAQFGAAFVSIEMQPELTVAPTALVSNLETNATYMSSSTDLLAAGAEQQLEVGDGAMIVFVVRIDPNAYTGPNDPMNNQVTATGQPLDENGDPLGDPVTDTSDSGPDPEGTNPGEPGDTGGPDDPTPIPLPAIGAAKSIIDTATSDDQSTVTVTYQIVVENIGNTPLTNLTLVDDLRDQYGPAFLSLDGATVAVTAGMPAATQLPVAAAGYDGGVTSDVLIDGSAAELRLGEQFIVTFDAVIDPSLATYAPLLNQATTTGDGRNFEDDIVTVTDESDSGVDPDSPNSGAPGDTGGVDDPTPLEYAHINAAKRVSDMDDLGMGRHEIEFTVTVINNGTVPLTELTFEDDVFTQFGGAGGAFVEVLEQPTFITTTHDPESNIELNATWMQPTSDTDLLDHGVDNTLAPGDFTTIRYRVLIDRRQPNTPRPLTNQVTASGVDPSGNPVSDLSDDGVNPEGNNEYGGPDDPTIIPVYPTGVFYNSVTRLPIEGVELTVVNKDVLDGDGNATPIPAACLAFNMENPQLSNDLGEYYININFGADALCPSGGNYGLDVMAEDVGYRNVAVDGTGQAVQGGVSPVEAGSYVNELCAGGDADPALPGCQIQVQPTAPTGGQSTMYYNMLTLTDALDRGVQFVENNHFPLDETPFGPEVITLVKQALDDEVSVGDVLPWRITGTSNVDVLLARMSVVDMLPPGLTYRTGTASLTVNGVLISTADPIINGLSLTWNDFDLPARGTFVIEFDTVVGAGVPIGIVTNRARAFDLLDRELSPTVTATARIVADAVFDCSDVIGKVFNDKNADGYPDSKEPGIAGVRIVGVDGLSIKTDRYGRYSIPCALIPAEKRGSNYILKLDPASLPAGYRITTENPRVVRLTQGKLAKLNFGATIHSVVRLDLADSAFVGSSLRLDQKWRGGMMLLIDKAARSNSVLRVSYRTHLKSDLANRRVNAVSDYLKSQLRKRGADVIVEREIIRIVEGHRQGTVPGRNQRVHNPQPGAVTQPTVIKPLRQVAPVTGMVVVPASQYPPSIIVPQQYDLIRGPSGGAFLRYQSTGVIYATQ